jgi:RNA polymerase sigma-70 factor (ECF subfamily)
MGSCDVVDRDDDEIVRAVCAGDTEAFAELVDRYQAMAIKVAFSLLGNEQDAYDAAQEAFISAYQALPRFRGGAKFSTWLYRIVANKCKDVYRKRARRADSWLRISTTGSSAREDQIMDIHDPQSGPALKLYNREVAEALSEAISELPLKQRMAFVLHHLHGMALNEVADVMQCRVGTVKSHVFRATTALKSRMQPWLQEVV